MNVISVNILRYLPSSLSLSLSCEQIDSISKELFVRTTDAAEHI